MKIERVPAKCFVERLVCSCGTEMRFALPTEHAGGRRFVHVCPSCSAFADKAEQYPRLVWEAK